MKPKSKTLADDDNKPKISKGNNGVWEQLPEKQPPGQVSKMEEKKDVTKTWEMETP